MTHPAANGYVGRSTFSVTPVLQRTLGCAVPEGRWGAWVQPEGHAVVVGAGGAVSEAITGNGSGPTPGSSGTGAGAPALAAAPGASTVTGRGLVGLSPVRALGALPSSTADVARSGSPGVWVLLSAVVRARAWGAAYATRAWRWRSWACRRFGPRGVDVAAAVARVERVRVCSPEVVFRPTPTCTTV